MILIEKGVLGVNKVKLFSCRVCPNRHRCKAWNSPSDPEDLEEFKKSGIMPGCDMWGREYMLYIEGDEVFSELGEWRWAELMSGQRETAVRG